MKDFIKWLGVNEKVAKVVVWLLIIMVMLILTNTMLESIGFPHYAITYQNLIRIKETKALDYIASWLTTFLNFFAMIFLIFRIKEFKKIFKYSVLYWAGNYVVSTIFNLGILQVYIVLFIIIFSYLYSGKNKKYILYAIVINIVIEGICYYFKARLVTFSSLSKATQCLLSIDYFIIMIIIILVKEIYIKKRSEKDDRQSILVGRIQKRRKTSKKSSKKSS